MGAALIGHLQKQSSPQMLVGTWAASEWAIRFYVRHGFEVVSLELKDSLLKTYWTIPERQVETSVVLANPALCITLRKGAYSHRNVLPFFELQVLACRGRRR